MACINLSSHSGLTVVPHRPPPCYSEPPNETLIQSWNQACNPGFSARRAYFQLQPQCANAPAEENLASFARLFHELLVSLASIRSWDRRSWAGCTVGRMEWNRISKCLIAPREPTINSSKLQCRTVSFLNYRQELIVTSRCLIQRFAL